MTSYAYRKPSKEILSRWLHSGRWRHKKPNDGCARWFSTSTLLLNETSATKRSILTLDPERMESMGQQVYDVSRLQSANYSFYSTTASQEDTPFILYYKLSRRAYTSEKKAFASPSTWKPGNSRLRPIAFPANTKGTLYFNRQPGRPEIAADLRFRICESVDKFQEGKDLASRSNEPWAISLFNICWLHKWKPVRSHLLQEGLLDEYLASDIMSLPLIGEENKKWMYTIHDPLIINLHAPSCRVGLMTRKTVKQIDLRQAIHDTRPKNGGVYFLPYRGRIRVQFELSTLPQHASVPTLVLRVIETLTPIQCIIPDYDYYLTQPHVGELISKRSPTDPSFHTPWALPLDRGGNANAILDAFGPISAQSFE